MGEALTASGLNGGEEHVDESGRDSSRLSVACLGELKRDGGAGVRGTAALSERNAFPDRRGSSFSVFVGRDLHFGGKWW